MRRDKNKPIEPITLSTGNVTLNINIVGVERQKLDCHVMAREIYQRTDNGTALPDAERRIVEPFLDPAFETDDLSMLERFVKVHDDVLAGAFIPRNSHENPMRVDETGLVSWRGRAVRKFPDMESTRSDEGRAALEEIAVSCGAIEASGGTVTIITLAQFESRTKQEIEAPEEIAEGDDAIAPSC